MIRAPELDDVDFAALLDQARALIPRYAPDWTDHNYHDPGITLLDLLAWVADLQVYRIGFVGDRHLAAFAALLGVTPRPAAPARGLIWPDCATEALLVEAGKAATADDASDLAFRISRSVQLSGTTIESIRHVRADGGASAVRLGQPLAVASGDSIELTLAAPLTAAAGSFTLGLAVAPELAGEPDPRRTLSIDTRATATGAWQPLPDLADETAGLSSSGVVAFGARPTRWLRLRLPAYLAAPVTIARIALDVLPIAQIEMPDSIEIGPGNGEADQSMAFDLAGLLPEDGAPDFGVRSADGAQWDERADLLRSGPDERHFMRDPRHGTLVFGNGVNGRKPASGLHLSVSGVRRTKGAAGNLGHGQRWHVAPLDGVFGTNPFPIAGGRDADTIDALIDAMRLRAQRRDALVTDTDLASAALGLTGFGVADVEIMPRLWPALPNVALCGALTLVVRTATGHAPAAHVEAIAARLAPRRLLGERLFVVAPQPVPIAIAATVAIDGGDIAEIRSRIAAVLTTRLSDGVPVATTWPAGRPVTVGEIETLIAATPEVRAIASVAIARRGAALARADIVLGPTEVAVLDRALLDIQIVGGVA
ncbi:baseplate J/gp47 family protein [Sphingomonas sp. PAMC 26605]|uniref:baseplate J/gp47 family protein n=1 Tax=Sphingomonas sp. PAMC 26605 TaxID=1112214 RepID=UPI00026CCA4A|nr:baseplate J/gp47 family protein [Sphingomonas sp. PAMC 26605]